MNRPNADRSSDNWTQKLVGSNWAQTLLSEIKELRQGGGEPARAFL